MIIITSFLLSLNPSETLAVSPLTTLDLSPTGIVNTNAMLLSILPLGLVILAITLGKDSVALFLVVDILTFVASVICPGKHT
jgi:hypothetical protein